MITAIDTNILLDILIKDSKHYEGSKRLLEKALYSGALIISEVVYAELVTQFERREKLDEFLRDAFITLLSSTPEALQEAGKAWSRYIKKRNKRIQCPQCGKRLLIECKNCSYTITTRQHIISDFLIGGHAKVLADRLLTRDRGYYRAYFKDLTLFT